MKKDYPKRTEREDKIKEAERRKIGTTYTYISVPGSWYFAYHLVAFLNVLKKASRNPAEHSTAQQGKARQHGTVRRCAESSWAIAELS